MAVSSVVASGLNAAFLQVQQAYNNRQDQLNEVTATVTQQAKQQAIQSVQIAASQNNDQASGVLTGRGQKLNISI